MPNLNYSRSKSTEKTLGLAFSTGGSDIFTLFFSVDASIEGVCKGHGTALGSESGMGFPFNWRDAKDRGTLES